MKGASLDFGLSLLAGEQVWEDEDETPTPLLRSIALAEACCFAWLVSAAWLMALARSPSPSGIAQIAPHIATIAALVLSSRPLGLLGGYRRPANFAWSVLWRTTAVAVLVGALLVNAPGFGGFVLLPLGLVAGFEAATSAWSLGIDVRPWQWASDVARSGLHAGVVAGVALAVVAGETSVALGAYAVIVACVLLACGTAAAVDGLRELQRAQDDRLVQATRAAEHRQGAHWLHDDVSAHLGLARLKLRQPGSTTDDVARTLDDLDHEIRLRQLEELFLSGTVRLAEILQPYVRRAQHAGATIERVPSFEEASLIVDVETGRRFGRAAAILTSNALNAGATRLSYAVAITDGHIALTVTDDAGGFELGAVPAGRGLWTLQRELGDGSLQVTPAGAGSEVTARVARPHALRAVAAAG